MRAQTAAVALVLLLTGCATEALPPAAPVPSVKAALDAATAPPALESTPTPPAPGEPAGSVAKASPFHLFSDALDKLGNNRLLSAVNTDADDTLAWVDTMQAMTPPGLSPLAEFRARACPTAIKVATADLQDKIQLLKALLGGVDAKARGFDPTQPEIVLFFTKLRYGPAASGILGMDPKAALEQLKADVFERVTAVIDSCRAVIPAKQMEELVKLASKAGLLGVSGGAAAPFLGILP